MQLIASQSLVDVSQVKSSQVAFNENVANAQTYKRMWKKYDKVQYDVTITY